MPALLADGPGGDGRAVADQSHGDVGGRVESQDEHGPILASPAPPAAVYLRISWTRMDHACTTDVVWPAHAASVTFGWSWWPPGFACGTTTGPS